MGMDFFRQQDLSRKASRRMVGIYILAVLCVGAAVHALVSLAMAFSAVGREGEFGGAFLPVFLNPRLALATLGVTFALIVVVSLSKIAALKSGGSAVAESMGGRRVLTTTQDFNERRLLNVVEEMALASGVAMPCVYVLDGEPGMNAFAAGYSTKDAAVAVTRGLLDALNREELQAVIAHEFSHILNGDMKLNIRLVGFLFGIFALTIVGVGLFHVARMMAFSSGGRSRNKKDNGAAVAAAIVALGLICWIVGYIGFFFGRVIQSGISRQREYLADASAVQFTRNPSGLANALKLIGAQGSVLQSAKAMEVSHMLFASGLKSVFATHPPLAERIRRWDPDFDGDFSKVRRSR